ncbi:MAG TPA: cytochrome c oxidase subunit II [Terriglobia bacterium]|nr:cytochrome c oxidase subunit II [Terriglobia bacterium]
MKRSAFPFMPEEASSVSGHVDALFIFLVVLTIIIAVGIFGMEIYYFIKYRRRAVDEVPTTIRTSLRLEVAWTLIPFVITMIIFVWGARLYFEIYHSPTEAMDIYVTAKQWMWRFQHPGGQREINELHVPLDRKVKLIMASEDVIHSFFVPAFRIKYDVVPGQGRYTLGWFQAVKPGRYHLFCAEYCGTNHSLMGGWIVVLNRTDFQAWLSGGGSEGSLSSKGEKLFQQLACNTCHRSDAQGRGPVLQGLYGSSVVLDNGETVLADESYIHESILNPQAKVVAGFQRPSIMPTFRGLIDEEQLLQLVAYIKSIGSGQGAVEVTTSGTAP